MPAGVRQPRNRESGESVVKMVLLNYGCLGYSGFSINFIANLF